jgi:hypothetical protein
MTFKNYKIILLLISEFLQIVNTSKVKLTLFVFLTLYMYTWIQEFLFKFWNLGYELYTWCNK